jgi:hypothetical protein
VQLRRNPKEKITKVARDARAETKQCPKRKAKALTAPNFTIYLSPERSFSGELGLAFCLRTEEKTIIRLKKADLMLQ